MIIARITNKEDFIKYYYLMKDIPLFDITPETCLAKCLTGEFWGYLGTGGKEPVCIVIGRDYGKMAFIVGVWAKNSLKPFLSSFWAILKDQGYTTARSSSMFDIEAYQKLLGMKKLWTVYEREL